jgi:hypothetical protein
MEKISYVDTAKNISDKIINDLFPEEMSHFQIFWGIFKEYLNKWRDIDPDEWPFKVSYQKISKDIAITNISEIISLNGPKIALIISAVLVKIAEKYDFSINKENKELMSIIEKYGNIFKASPPLIKHLQNRIPELVDLKNIEDLREKGKVEESKAIKKEAYARGWTLRTDDPKNGDYLSKREYDKILMKKEKYPLLIIKHQGIRSIFVYGKAQGLSPLKYDLLEYVLKNKGHGGNLINLLGKVWKDERRANRLQKEQDNSVHDKDMFNLETAHVRKGIVILNQFLSKKLKVRLASHRTGQYRLTGDLEYYLFEII